MRKDDFRGVWLGESADGRPAAGRAPGPLPSTPWGYFLRSLHYLKPYHRLAAVSIVLLVLGILDALLAPWPFKSLVDNVLGGEPLPPAADALLGGVTGSRTG